MNDKRLREEIQWATMAKISENNYRDFGERSIANTDLHNMTQWSAYGGTRAVRVQAASSFSHSLTRLHEEAYMTGLSFELSMKPDALWSFKFLKTEMMGGSAVKYSKQKSDDLTSGLALRVECNVNERFDSYLNNVISNQIQNGSVIHTAHTPGSTMGPVDAFEYSTFYLGSRPENFQDFYGNIVNPTWITTDTGYATISPDHPFWVSSEQTVPSQISIIRDAKKNLIGNFIAPKDIWRIAHRITYVSRLYASEFNTTTTPEL